MSSKVCSEFRQNTLAFLCLLFAIIGFPGYQVKAQTSSYGVRHAPIGGGGFVTGIVTHKTSGDIYCRTDVGGAYRWDAANNKWVQLLDWISEDQRNFSAVEALALDPQNANNVYMLCGLLDKDFGKTAILKSTDKGNTFTVIDVSSKFKAHGNGMGRSNGERLTVDPHNSNILFCGTRQNGLWKSTDAGITWNLAWEGVTTTSNDNGICFVLYDPLGSVVNGVTQTMYIGVSRTGSANIYRSTDGGTTFTAISATTNFMPHRAALVGTTMYVVQADKEGPYGIEGTGGIYKLNTSTGTWTNVTPNANNYAYGSVSVDPSNVNRVVVSTINNFSNNQYGTTGGDFVYLSTDGGTNWTLKNGSNSTYNNDGIGWTNGQLHWAGSIEFTPGNTAEVRVVSGKGLFSCSNIDAANPSWKLDVRGMEEAGLTDGISIPGAPFISTFGDITGFVHNDLTSYPASTLQPAGGSNWGIDYAAASTSKIVRTTNGDDGASYVYYSTNQGSAWTACSTTKGAAGKVAISADGVAILHSPSGSSTIWRTTDNGGSWTSVSGVAISNAIPIADRVNSNYFYIHNLSSGQMLVSSDKGASFSVAGNPGATSTPWEPTYIRTVPGNEGHVWVPLIGNGLKYSTDHGATYTTVSNVTYCSAVGIGKADVSAAYPTVFIWGTVGGVKGLFRSTDKGANWIRMNDDAHEFGGTTLLIGDFNVFGRVYMWGTLGRGLIYWDPCSPTTIAPWAQVNGGSWQQTATATLAAGGSLMFGPQPVTGGSWSWSGPNNFSATTREVSISNIQTNQAGNYVATYTNSGGCQSSQTFTVTVSGFNIVTITNRATGLMIDGMGRTSAGSTCSQWASSGSWNQMWILETSGAYVYIKNRNTGLYIDGRGNSTNGSYVGQWSSAISDNLQWQQETTGGYVKFKNRATGLYLDGMGNTTNGADLAQWSSGGSYNQQWTTNIVTNTGLMSVASETLKLNTDVPECSLELYPNPFTTNFNLNICTPKEVLCIRIFDVMGKVVETIQGSAVSSIVSMGASLKPGIYIVKVEGANSSQTFKALKN